MSSASKLGRVANMLDTGEIVAISIRRVVPTGNEYDVFIRLPSDGIRCSDASGQGDSILGALNQALISVMREYAKRADEANIQAKRYEIAEENFRNVLDGVE
jgi:hypothetical protein